MIEKLVQMMDNEPVASTIAIMAFGYIILEATGLWKWLPDKIYSIGNKSKPSDNNDFNKVCPACKREYKWEDEHFAYCESKGKYCRESGKPISKS